MEKKEKKKIFSDEQQSAIDTRDRTVLVSAAAGSGKTTTLTERIIRQLLDEKNPVTIENMLIVTFTNASVYERIGLRPAQKDRRGADRGVPCRARK